MKSSAKLLGSRIVGAVHDASRAAGSTIIRNTPIPGLIEVQGVAKQLVNSLEDMDDYKNRCQVLSKRIAAIMKLLETHNQAVINLELQFFYNKLTTCQKQLSRLDSKRGLSNALRISRQLEVVERLEKEIDSSLQDMMLALLVERLSEPREAVVYQPPQPPKEVSPERLHYPKIKRCKLSINSMIRRSQADTKLGSIARSLARGTYRNQEVLVVQYSSKSQSSQVHNAFRGAIKAVIQEQHPNVLRFMGASDEGSSSENHYLVFDAGSTVSRQAYVHALRSVHDAFQFLTGVKDGMEFLLEHGIQTWSDIHISAAGQPVVCPPYWDSVELWEKSNHDVFSSLTGTTEPADFPLSTLSEILNTSCNRWPEFETTVRSHPTKLRDYHLMQIADELDLPTPPFLLVYSGSLPEFIISVGSVGAPDWSGAGYPDDCFHGAMTGWMSVSSLWTCTGWDALQTCQLEYWATGRKVVPWEEDVHWKLSHSGGGLSQESLGVLDPLGSSSDGWLSYGCFESSEWFGVGYELTISDSALFESSWKRFTETRIPSMAHLVDEEQDLHVVRHISVRIHCKPGKMHGFLPLYFHRRPSSMFNTEHYWGFLSDSPDPDVTPCHLVKAIQMEYSIHINTMRANDGWRYRAEQCFESIISRTPGAFNF